MNMACGKNVMFHWQCSCFGTVSTALKSRSIAVLLLQWKILLFCNVICFDRGDEKVPSKVKYFI